MITVLASQLDIYLQLCLKCESANKGLLRDCENRWIVCSARALVSGVDINLDLNITLSDVTGLATLPSSVPRLTWEAAEVTAVAAVTFC